MQKPIFDIEEAKQIISGEYGKILANLASNWMAPLWWKRPSIKDISFGTIFFLNTGSKIFAVTAYHVYQEYLAERAKDSSVRARISHLDFELSERLIDFNSNELIDIATFRIDSQEIYAVNSRPFEGSQMQWPPEPPQEHQPVFFCGYPKPEQITIPNEENNFGFAFVLCLASNVSSRRMTCQLEQDFLVPINNSPLRDVNNYFWGGISGAPVVKIVRNSIESYQLCGVVTGDIETIPNVLHVSHVRC